MTMMFRTLSYIPFHRHRGLEAASRLCPTYARNTDFLPIASVSSLADPTNAVVYTG